MLGWDGYLAAWARLDTVADISSNEALRLWFDNEALDHILFERHLITSILTLMDCLSAFVLKREGIFSRVIQTNKDLGRQEMIFYTRVWHLLKSYYEGSQWTTLIAGYCTFHHPPIIQ